MSVDDAVAPVSGRFDGIACADSGPGACGRAALAAVHAQPSLPGRAGVGGANFRGPASAVVAGWLQTIISTGTLWPGRQTGLTPQAEADGVAGASATGDGSGVSRWLAPGELSGSTVIRADGGPGSNAPASPRSDCS